MPRLIALTIVLSLLFFGCGQKTPEEQALEYVKMAEEKVKAKTYDEAIFLYNKALNIKKEAKWYIRLGQLKTAQDPHNWKESVEDYKKALALNPKNVELLYHITDIYLGKEETDEAMKYIQYLAANGGTEKELMWRIGMAFQGKKLEEEARFAYAIALQHDPNNETVKENIAKLDKLQFQIQEEWKAARMYNDMGQYEQAAVMYASLLDALPFELGLYDEAIKNLNKAIQHFKVRETKESIRDQIKDIKERKKAAREQKKKMDALTDEAKMDAVSQGLSFYDYLVKSEESE